MFNIIFKSILKRGVNWCVFWVALIFFSIIYAVLNDKPPGSTWILMIVIFIIFTLIKTLWLYVLHQIISKTYKVKNDDIPLSIVECHELIKNQLAENES